MKPKIRHFRTRTVDHEKDIKTEWIYFTAESKTKAKRTAINTLKTALPIEIRTITKHLVELRIMGLNGKWAGYFAEIDDEETLVKFKDEAKP